MEPCHDKKVPEPRPAIPKQERPRRFRFQVVRLEERIAPKFTHKTCGWTL
jgi:hypothetical protein